MSTEVNVDMERIIEKLGKVTDTRRQWGNLRHKLVDILFIGLVSVICGEILNTWRTLETGNITG